MPIRRFIILCTLVLLVSAPARAQFETASVVGTIRDTTGGVIPDATVTLTNTDTAVSVTQTSNRDGGFEFFTVKPGPYLVVAEKPGLATALTDHVTVNVGARLRVDMTMTAGGVTERVEVSASNLGLETDSSQRGQIVTGDQMRQLALNGREYSALALLTAGVRQSALNKSTNGTPREGAFNVNGLRSVFNNFLIDGVDNNAYGTSNQGFSNQVMQPPPDAVEELRVVTNNQSAEYGRSAGATVNVAFKSGTNQVHGSTWEFFRNTSLNSRSYFTPSDADKPDLERNQFGGVIGGPIVRNRAFFFGDYEGFRQDQQVTAFSTVPTPTQRQGVLAIDVRDPRTGLLYPAGTPLPMTDFARTVLSALPDPTGAGAANNYQILQSLTNHSDKGDGKVDVRPNARLSFFGRYGARNLQTVDQPPIPLPSGGGGNGTIYARNKQLALGTTYTPTATSLVEIRFGWSHTEGGKTPPGLGTGDALALYGLGGLPTDPRISGGLPAETITGVASLGRQATNPQWQYPTVWDPKINYTWLAGRQSFKAGYEFQQINVEVQDVNPLYGLDSYSGQFSRPSGAAANNLYNLADFMFGLRSQYALSTFFIANVRQQMHFAYLQDDIRAGDRLTVNAGVRYEYATPIWDAENHLTNYDPTTNTIVAASNGSIADRALVNPDRNNFGPRLGLAYGLGPGTVLRGGWGVSYVHVNRIGSANLLAINGPQVVRAVVTQSDPSSPDFRPTEQGYPADLTDPSQFNPQTALISYVDRDFHSSPVQSWFASVQQAVGPHMVVDVAYVGNRADDLLYLADYNQAAVNDAAGSIPLDARRPIPGFGDITYVFNGGKSRYQALQVEAKWQSRDLTLLSSLTLSQAKDNGAGSLENQNGNFPGPQDFHNIDAEFALSGYHQPYNSTTSFVWQVPIGRDRRWGAHLPLALDVLVGGWQMSGIYTMTPGEMVTLTYSPSSAFQVSGITNDFSGANNYRPNVVCDPYAPSGEQSITNWFNPACVVIPTDPSQPFGNASRNTVRGPDFRQFDLAAIKQIALGGGARVELRVEAFNLFNRVNFGPPNGNRSSPGFGTITTAYDARQIQLGAKILW
ncbi:MAG TPA: carboxypeptidase regulatory-like domain-containing protein [Vicinamibacterales bacterium]|nr:carboxypeptidase regulatory-like domain-containing protein [Vicinamibacterales bacterium]